MCDSLPLRSPGFSLSMREEARLETGWRTECAIIYYSDGRRPFPAAVCVRGGAWVYGGRIVAHGFADPIASCGVVIMVIDCRMPSE